MKGMCPVTYGLLRYRKRNDANLTFFNISLKHYVQKDSKKTSSIVGTAALAQGPVSLYFLQCTDSGWHIIFSFLSLNVLGISPLSLLMINYFVISWEERIGAMDTWNLSLYLHIQPD